MDIKRLRKSLGNANHQNGATISNTSVQVLAV